MSTDYELMNPQEILPRSVEDRGVLVYVLMTNHREGTHKPYYVGITHSPVARFSNHEKLHWHQRVFQRPAKVLIAGVVSHGEAEAAEQSLIDLLSQSRFKLLNAQINNPFSVFTQEDAPLGDLSTTDLADYLSSPGPIGSALKNWEALWLTPKLGGEKPSQLTRLFTNSSGVDMREHPDYISFPASVSPYDLTNSLVRQNVSIYQATRGSKYPLALLTLKIASAYNPDAGYCTSTFTQLGTACGIRPHKLSPFIKRLSLTGLWAVIPGTGSHASKYFPLMVEGCAERYLAATEYGFKLD